MGISIEMLLCEDMALCTDLACCCLSVISIFLEQNTKDGAEEQSS